MTKKKGKKLHEHAIFAFSLPSVLCIIGCISVFIIVTTETKLYNTDETHHTANIMRAFITLAFAALPFSAVQADDGLEKYLEPYMQLVAENPCWLSSRLQMYWSTNATDVFIMGESFDHPGGERAPHPTVKFNGTRSNASQYNRPKLEDIIPYDDTPQGEVTFISRATGVMERTHPSKTGCNIDGVNRQILGLASDAARAYVQTGKKEYADMARGVFDVFMRGIYYRNAPTDLNHGHQQTLVGMCTFEVIHEDALVKCCEIYKNLKSALHKDSCALYDATLKKWADLEIANGVPHNNWNMFQAEYITDIALVLKDNSSYSDGKGRQYYLDKVMNATDIRQWGMRKLCDFGFDADAHIWYESPGYSTTVMADLGKFANKLHLEAGIDMFAEIPEIARSIKNLPQYLMPNRMICGFGDTHPNYLNTKGMEQLLAYSKRRSDNATQDEIARLMEAVGKEAPAETVERYVSPNFYSEKVSWLIQRSGMDSRHDLAISLNGSMGNHMHANGISMELYGKGYVLGPDAGIGRSLYSGLDYQEYYSQFPAHNTVCVDGISSYPVMMSSHAFKLIDRFPADNSLTLASSKGDTHSTVEFLEPETNSRQVRTNGIVKTSSKGGYYIDIFRSRRNEGGDKFHDYFYHNLGQQMTLTADSGEDIDLQPTDELAFAGGHLYAYSYIYNKVGTETDKNLKTTFTINMPDGNDIHMTMWMKGERGREIFKALSPVNLEYERMPNQPYKIDEQPVLTFVARQHGEAWTKPFVAVYEPSANDEPSEIESVSYFQPKSKDPDAIGICVRLKSGATHYIFSSANGSEMRYEGMRAKGWLQVIKK